MTPSTPTKLEGVKRAIVGAQEGGRKRFKPSTSRTDDSTEQLTDLDEKENQSLVNDQLPTPVTTPTKDKAGRNAAAATAAQLHVTEEASEDAAAVQKLLVPDVYARASARLRVGASPNMGSDTLVGRESEHDIVRGFIESRLARDKTARKSLYISGPPGIGKTALVCRVTAEYMAKDGVRVVMENCASAGKTVWSRLARSAGLDVDGECDSRAEFEAALQRHGNDTFIICLDEIDHLVETCGKATLNAFFQIAHANDSNLVLIGIANALDLTFRHLDRTLLDITTDDGPLILPFQTYDSKTLAAVVEGRLADGSDDLSSLIDKRALDFASKKVAAHSGDVRVLFAVVRNALKLVRDQQKEPVAVESAPKVTMQFMLGALRNAGLASLPALSAKLADMTLPTRCALLSVVIAVRRQEIEARKASGASSKQAGSKASTSKASSAAQPTVTVSTASTYSVYRTVLSKSTLSGLNVAQMTSEEYHGLIDCLESSSLVSVARPKKPTGMQAKKFKPMPMSQRTKGMTTMKGSANADDKHLKLLHDRLTLEDALEEVPRNASNAVKVVVELSRSLLNDERARLANRYEDRRQGCDEEAPREYSAHGLDLTKAYIGSRAL